MDRELITLQERRDHLGHPRNGRPEHDLALLDEIVLATQDTLDTRGTCAPARRHIQEALIHGIRAADAVEETDCRVLSAFEQDDTRAVAEQHRRRAIRLVSQEAHPIRPAQQETPSASCLDETRCRRERVDETRAGGGEIEAPGVRDAKLPLHHGRSGWQEIIGRAGRHNDTVDLRRENAA